MLYASGRCLHHGLGATQAVKASGRCFLPGPFPVASGKTLGAEGSTLTLSDVFSFFFFLFFDPSSSESFKFGPCSTFSFWGLGRSCPEGLGLGRRSFLLSAESEAFGRFVAPARLQAMLRQSPGRLEVRQKLIGQSCEDGVLQGHARVESLLGSGPRLGRNDAGSFCHRFQKVRLLRRLQLAGFLFRQWSPEGFSVFRLTLL